MSVCVCVCVSVCECVCECVCMCVQLPVLEERYRSYLTTTSPSILVSDVYV